MRQFPDVLGMDRSAAVSALEKHGLSARIRYTRPDKGETPQGVEKVVQQEQISECELQLTVCSVTDAFRSDLSCGAGRPDNGTICEAACGTDAAGKNEQ